MKYKVGDKVRVKSLDWYNANKDEYGVVLVENGDYMFCKSDIEWCGKIVTIAEVCLNEYYRIVEDFNKYRWTDEMIEGLVEEETLIERVDDNGLPFNEWLSHKGAFHIPDGYELKDENGNVINATKIVLEKKKKEYPKTYEECLKILNIPYAALYIQQPPRFNYKLDLLLDLQQLLICRDAYWSLAGDWKPEWSRSDQEKFTIRMYDGYRHLGHDKHLHSVLAFPTEEMRDAFYENFKELIEICKELL